MTVKRMDNVGIVVEDIDAAIDFFTELGLEPEWRAPIDGGWADGTTGLRDMRDRIVSSRAWRQVHGKEGGATGIDDDFAVRSSRASGYKCVQFVASEKATHIVLGRQGQPT